MKSHFVPAIEKPCPVKWESMTGNDKRRYCEHCQLHVHNLSAMTTSEQREVFAAGTDRKCISYMTRADAQTVDLSTWLKIQSTSWLPRWLAAIIAVFSSSCTQSYRTTGVPLPPPSSQDSSTSSAHGHAPAAGRRLMGRVKVIKE